MFVIFGVGKFSHHAKEVASFANYGLPEPDLFVYLIGGIELVGGAMLILGLAVRFAALVLAGNMIGAIISSGLGQGEVISLTLAPALFVACLFLLWSGAGRWSLDRLLVRPKGASGKQTTQD